MKKIEIYLADDGQVFNDEFLCLEHELENKLRESGVVLFTRDGYRTIDASISWRIKIENIIPEDILDDFYHMYGATELPKTKGDWVLLSGEEQNNKEFCADCSYYHNDFGESEPCCHNGKCHEFGWVKLDEN